MKSSSIEQFRFEPTVFGSVRRYRTMVVVVALMTAAAAVGFTLVQPEVYRAQATVSVPQPLLLQGQGSDQYLDSQVLLLQSQEVAERAVRIANGALEGNVLAVRDFSGDDRSLEITPPEGASPGSYGSTMIVVSFTGPSAAVAQEGANALVRAYDDVRSAAITAQGEATVAGIENAIADATTERQRTDLMNQRTQALIDQQVDLARQPTVAWALEPQDPINGNSKKGGAIGLVIGALLGAALAFARGSRRRCIDDRSDPAAFYGAPLLGEIPASATKKRRSRTAAAGLLPITVHPRSVAAEAFRFAAGSIGRICAARGQRLSLAFVSAADAGRSAVVANVALAIAESGTRVLAIDADAGNLTTLLLPDTPVADGFEQVLSGQRAAADCVEPSPLHRGVSVLRSGRTTRAGVTSAAFSKAVEKVLAEAKASFDVVLIDSPALLRVAHASELVDASDGTIIVAGPHEPIQDHLDMVDRLDLIESEVVGYIYNTASKRSRLAHTRGRSPARSGRRAISSAVPAPMFESTHSRDGDDYPSPVLEAGR